MPFEYLEEEAIADVGIKATGATLKQLFEDTAIAVYSLLTDINSLDTSIVSQFNFHATTLEKLLYKLLDEIIYLKDAELFFPKQIELNIKQKNGSWILEGKFFGCEFNYKIHPMGNDIKAITLHEFYINETENGWESHVIIDI